MNVQTIHAPLRLPSNNTLFLRQQMDVDSGIESPDGAEEGGGIEQSGVMALSLDDIFTVLTRQNTASVTYSLDDGHTRTSRESYVLVGDVLYIPSSAALGSFVTSDRPSDRSSPWALLGAERMLECEINELDGLSEWRYVWLRGLATLLQPTGGAPEREAWRTGIERLRGVVPRLREASMEALAFSNFAVIMLANLEPCGVRLMLEGGLLV